MKLALVPTQIVSPKDNKPVMGIVQVNQRERKRAHASEHDRENENETQRKRNGGRDTGTEYGGALSSAAGERGLLGGGQGES